MSNEIANNRSALRDFLGSVATVSGDLSNITAPPFVLAENSTVEIPQYWADHPSLFVSQAAEEDAEKRALSVLKYFIGTLRNQQYAGRPEDSGVKKPLNAFLGEIFLGHWRDEEIGETNLVAEQVSHHPPVTACYLWNDKHGVRASGFTQQEITFSGNVNIKQKGYAMLHLDKWDEDYLIPVPNIKVKGILSGTPYPELSGSYSLVGSNGYVSRIKFDGKSFFGTGQKNHFEATLYHTDRPGEVLYTAHGAWNGRLEFKDARADTKLDDFDVHELKSVKVQVADLSEQDPWESRNAWKDVIAALHRGDMKGVADSKSRLEEGQRQMRKEEEANGKQWQTLYFDRIESEPMFEKLSAVDPSSFVVDKTSGIWKANREAIANARKPYHGGRLPSNEKTADPVQNGAAKKPNINGQNGSVVSGTRESGSTGDEPNHQPESGLQSENRAEPGGETQINGLAVRPKSPSSEEQQRAQGTAAQSSTEVDNARAQGTPLSKEPSNAQVEAFLRAKASSLDR